MNDYSEIYQFGFKIFQNIIQNQNHLQKITPVDFRSIKRFELEKL